jgi:hypothetical protein
MFYKLLKFVIMSRFSKQLLVLMIVLFAFSIYTSIKTGPSGNVFEIYGPAFLAFFLVLPILSGGIAVLKSDRDFLFTLPVKRSDLAVSLFIVQFLSFGLIIVYILGYSFSNLKPVFIYALIDITGLILAMTSLGPITYSLKPWWRALLALLLALWSLSVFFGFPLSPAAIYTGHPIFADVSSVVLAAVTVPLALRSLSRVDLDLMKTFTRYTSGQVKHTRRFSGMTPIKAIYAENFFTVEIAGRMNSIGGGGAYRSARFKLKNGIIVSAVLAAVYYYLFSITKLPLQEAEVAIMVLSIYSVIFIMFFTMGVLGNERLWLGFMTRDPTHYLRDKLTAKSLSMTVLLAPLAVSNFLIAVQGNLQALNFGLLLLVEIPSLIVIVVYTSAFLSPFQIKEDLMMPGQFNLRQMATLLPASPAWFFVALSYGFLELGLQFLALTITVLAAAILGGIAIALISSKTVGSKIINRLVAAGFI